jgi:hypothetical protein
MSSAQRVLLNLVGEQPMPSLIPILQYRPDVVIFLYSDRTRSQMADVCAALELADGLDTTKRVKVEIDPAQFIRSADVVAQVLADYPDGQFLFNLSGGTKLMALSLYRAAEGKGDVIYVSADDECILRLQAEAIVEEPTTAQVPAAAYLRAHGASIDPARSRDVTSLVPAHFEIARHLAYWAPGPSASDVPSALRTGLEDWRKAVARRRKVRPPDRYPVRISLPHPSPTEAELVDLLVRHGLAKPARRGASFILDNHDAWAFLNGGWLEGYAFDVARQSGVFHDCRVHVGIEHAALGQNELDLIAMRGAVATLCSCKTGSVPRGAAKVRWLDELEARASALGAFCGKLLIGSQPRQAYGEAFVQRAEQMGVEVATGEDLPVLAAALDRASRHKGKPRKT